MLGRPRSIAVVAASTLALLAMWAALARADAPLPPNVLTSDRPLNARVWGMGGACAALSGARDQTLCNPAGAMWAEKQEVIIGYLDADMVAALEMYDAPEADGSPTKWPIAPASPEPEDAQANAPYPAPLPSPERVPDTESLRCGFARRCAPGSRWTWGAAAESTRAMDASLLGLGLLYHRQQNLALGLKWDNLLVTGGHTVATGTVGAAYEAGRCTVALDLFGIAGDGRRQQQTMAGAEYRFDNGFALRLGSAAGNLSYGIGYRMGDWSVDLAQLSVGHGEVLIPGTTVRSANDLTFLSVSCRY